MESDFHQKKVGWQLWFNFLNLHLATVKRQFQKSNNQTMDFKSMDFPKFLLQITPTNITKFCFFSLISPIAVSLATWQRRGG